MAKVILPNNLNSKESTAMAAKTKRKPNVIEIGSLMESDRDAFAALLRGALQMCRRAR